MHDGKRFTPVALAGEQPVAQFVLHLACAETFFLKVSGGFLYRFGFAKSVEKAGVDEFALTLKRQIDLISVKKQNREFKQKLDELNAQLGAQTELKMENERLSQLLGFKHASKMTLLAARVIARDLMPDHYTITVDRGLSHGVQKHMAALTIGGVVGYTFRVDNESSQILLLTDGYAAIDALVQRSRAVGLVEGVSRDGCRLRYLKRSDDVKVGDLVVTSGLFNIFPKGFPIGTVSAIDKSKYGTTQEVDVKPAVEALNLEELFIVINANHQDLTPAAGAEE